MLMACLRIDRVVGNWLNRENRLLRKTRSAPSRWLSEGYDLKIHPEDISSYFFA